MNWMRTPCGTIISIFDVFLLLILLLPVRFIATLCRQSKSLMQHRHEVFAVIGCSIEGEAGCGAGTCFEPYILPLPGSQSPNLSWWISGFDATRFSMFFGEPIFGSFSHYILLVLEQEDIKEPLIYPAAHLRHIFSRLLLAEKLDVHPVHLAFFAIADEKICTESVPPH